MSRAAIQANIITKLKAVTGVENVYAGPFRVEDLQAVVDKLQDSENVVLQYWTIRRVRSIPEGGRLRGTTSCQTTYIHTWELTCWMGYRENVSEDRLQNLIDDVLTNLMDDRTWDGAGWGSELPISLEAIRDEPAFNVYGTRATFTINVATVHMVTNT